jgi:hypothetical protein
LIVAEPELALLLASPEYEAVMVTLPVEVLVYVTWHWATAGSGPPVRVHEVEENDPVEEVVVKVTLPVGLNPFTVATQVTVCPAGGLGGPHESAVVVVAGGTVTEAVPELGRLAKLPP